MPFQKCPVCNGLGILGVYGHSCPTCLGARIIDEMTGLPPTGQISKTTTSTELSITTEDLSSLPKTFTKK